MRVERKAELVKVQHGIARAALRKGLPQDEVEAAHRRGHLGENEAHYGLVRYTPGTSGRQGVMGPDLPK